MFEVDEQLFRREVRELKHRIHTDPSVRARYDMDGDGEVSGEEWERAVESLRKELAQRPPDPVEQDGNTLRLREPASSLTSCREVIVRQRVEMGEVLIGWEQRNRYVFIDGESGMELGGAEENGSGIGNALIRQFLGPGRPLDLTIAASQDGIFVEGKRPWAILGHLAPPTMTVSGNHGEIGTVKMVWPIALWRRYRIHSTHGPTDLYVEGKIWRPWRFPIVRGSRQVACIKKKWSGIGKEMFTDADNFTVAFEDPGLSADERMLILATAMAIDYDFFEKKAGD